MDINDIVKEAVVIHQSTPFREAVSIMMTKHTNTILVTDDTGELVGEVSVTDLLDAVIPTHMSGDDVIEFLATDTGFMKAVVDASEKPVEEFMSIDFTPVTLKDTFTTVAANAIGFGRARIPVVSLDNRPIGLISRQGLKAILAKTLGIK